MTLDEAIKHCEEVMIENLEKTKDRNASDPIAINCFECADEHRQLAEWLKELEAHREAWEKVNAEINKNLFIEFRTGKTEDNTVDNALLALKHEVLRIIAKYRPKEGDAE